MKQSYISLYVSVTPEVGKYLALDLGGTNFRVILVELQKNHFEMTSRSFLIPVEKMQGSGKDLFDHVASCLQVFILEQRLKDESLPLGFTYSFPLIQKAIDRGIIERWTKGFKCDDIIGEDVVKVLQEALVRKGVRFEEILRDLVGTR